MWARTAARARTGKVNSAISCTGPQVSEFGKPAIIGGREQY